MANPIRHPEVLDHIAVVLVHPQGDGNVGQVARAMKNFGLTRLVLVNACPLDTDLCRQMATNSYDVIERAQHFSDLQSALGPFHFAIGTSRRLGKSRPRFCTSRALPEWLLPKLTGHQNAALIFGNEVSGLDNSELDRCDQMVEIVTDPAHRSLNLAQAVVVVAYELFCRATEVPGHEDFHMPATRASLDRMYAQMRRIYFEIGFIDRVNPERIMRRLRRLYGRAAITEQEVRILRGILQDTEWYFNHLTKVGKRDGYREMAGDGES